MCKKRRSKGGQERDTWSCGRGGGGGACGRGEVEEEFHYLFINPCITLSHPIFLVCFAPSGNQDIHYVQGQTPFFCKSPASICSGPTIWNSLPLSIRSCISVASFKRNLKTHLFSL